MVCHLLDIVQCARLSDATPTRLIHITVRWAEKKTFEQIWTNVNYEMGHQETMKLRSHDIRGLSEWHNKHMHSNEFFLAQLWLTMHIIIATIVITLDKLLNKSKTFEYYLLKKTKNLA